MPNLALTKAKNMLTDFPDCLDRPCAGEPVFGTEEPPLPEKPVPGELTCVLLPGQS